MGWDAVLGRLLGYENVDSIDAVRPSFGADWAREAPGWVFFGCAALVALAFWFYLRLQTRGRRRGRIVLAVARGLLLSLMFLILADPILEVALTSHPRPLLWVLLDGTDSMNIADELPSDQRARFDAAVGLDEAQTAGAASAGPTRADYVRALLSKSDDNLLEKLAEKYRLKAYIFDRPDGARPIDLSDDPAREVEPRLVASQLTTEGQVTALGAALEDLALRHAGGNLAGVLVVSDFAQNTGAMPLTAAKKLRAPIFAVGVGPRGALDAAVDLQAPLKMKKAEQSTLVATVRHQQLAGREVTVRVVARRLEAGDDSGGGEIVVGQKSVALGPSAASVEFPFTPEQTGRFVFAAEVDPLEGEIVEQNNRAEREATIIDDFMRLLFVEYEPTWEWRFIKEVFHRDRLVGLRGFRTYLRSSDPVVRETNDLFLPSLTMPRREFFQYDVIFLGDMPSSALSTRFCEMAKEFVGQFGGGLVVMAGPRFGPGELAATPLADMLPVVLDPDARLRDERPFTLKLSPLADQYDFMRLGADARENELAWNNLGELPWYQPVRRLESSASNALAVHPTDVCVDGKTPQPLIAIRKYGRGEVIYLGFNEMWRLRRKYGELYYRQFWGQMIHRLGLSHALGNQKRFVVRTDRQRYRADDKVLLTVEAYDENFEPLTAEDLGGRASRAELERPAAGGATELETLSVSQLRPGVFEARIPVFEGGEYRLRVEDPVGDEDAEVRFQVAALSAERRSAARDHGLQTSLARATGGKTYELDTVANFVNDYDPPELTETTIEIIPLWSTWFCFGLVVLLMLGEWFGRKLVNLS
jgi:hypothetical protein